MQTSGDFLADRRFLYGCDLARDGDYAAAADLFTQTLERAGDWAPGWLALGDAKARGGDRDGAIAAFRRATDLDRTGIFGASLALAALTGESPPAAADPAYVRALFDDYAPRFDEHLAEGLAYRAPTLLRETLDRLAPPPRRFARALDLGCGTGLMGQTLRSRVDRLCGVDLSPAMIEKAREKGLYDDLVVGEMLSAIAAHAPLALVIAADVFVYVGELRPVFSSVAAALEPLGLFAFTVQSTSEGVVVGTDRRFAHSRDHVFSRASDAGLTVVLCDPASIRRDVGRDVPGLLVVLRR